MVVKNKIVVTGGSGRFAKSLKKTKCKYKFIYPNKNLLNITNLNSIKFFIIPFFSWVNIACRKIY